MPRLVKKFVTLPRSCNFPQAGFEELPSPIEADEKKKWRHQAGRRANQRAIKLPGRRDHDRVFFGGWHSQPSSDQLENHASIIG
jgi:hypothetical protein